MALLIDQPPIHCRVDSHREPPEEYWSLRVPILITAVGQVPLPGAAPQSWVIDAGFTGEAFARRYHFEEAGIDFDKARLRRLKLTWSASEEEKGGWLCRAHLWLVSNIPGRKLHRLRLYKGVACNDERVPAPDPERHRALIGMALLIRLGLKVEVNAADRNFSIWSSNP